MAITKHDLKSLIESLSHKLRTPLSVISNNAHFIGKENPTAQDDVAMILKKVKEMSELLSQIYQQIDYTPTVKTLAVGALAEELGLSLSSNTIRDTAVRADPALLKSLIDELGKLLPIVNKSFLDETTIQLSISEEHSLRSKEALLAHAPQLAALILQLSDLGSSFEINGQSIYLRLR